jgi:hypothetical protein
VSHEEVRRLIVEFGSEALPEAVTGHLAECSECSQYAARIRSLGARLADLPSPPDLTTRILAGLPSPRPLRPLRFRLVAGLAMGVVMGVVLMSGLVPQAPERTAFAAEFPAKLLSAQTELGGLTASVEILEFGWHPEVERRHYTGTIGYSPPESFQIRLDDQTEYPSDRWLPNDVEVEIGSGLWSAVGVVGCPGELQPECGRILTEGITGREPFPADRPIPLEIVLPFDSFAFTTRPSVHSVERRNGVPAAAVSLSYAQAAPLVEGWLRVGNWRRFHPSDSVVVWLELDRLVPVEISIAAGVDPLRDVWATRLGYADEPGRPLLQISLTDLDFSGAEPSRRPVGSAAGFLDGPPSLDLQILPPAGFEVYRTGVAEDGASVWSYTDGRAWVKVRATDQWSAGRLFGGLGEVVTPVLLGTAGIGYLGGDGRQVGIHGEGVEAVVEGSVGWERLVEFAGALGVEGREIPNSYPEAAAASLEAAQAAVPTLLVSPAAEVGSPSVRVMGDTVAQVYPGSGGLGFVLVQVPGESVPPPFDPDTVAVSLRDTVARFTPSLGELAWVEKGAVVSLRSGRLGLAQLVELARGLR